MKDFWDRLDYVGGKIFNLEMIEASDYYLRGLRRLLKIEFETARKNKQDWAKDALGFRREHSREQMDNENITSNLSYYHIDSVKKFGIIAATKKLDKFVTDIFSMLKDLLIDSLALTDRITRGSIVYSITNCISDIHKAAVDNGLNNTTFTIGWLDHFVSQIDKRYFKEAEELTKKFCKMAIYSIENKYYIETHNLGVLCRQFAEEYPNLVIITLDALDKSYDIVNDEKDIEVRESWKKEIIREMDSAERWNKKRHKIITNKVKKILASKK